MNNLYEIERAIAEDGQTTALIVKPRVVNGLLLTHASGQSDKKLKWKKKVTSKKEIKVSSAYLNSCLKVTYLRLNVWIKNILPKSKWI